MKTRILAAAFTCLLFTSTSSFAFDRKGSSPSASREVAIAGKFQKIRVGENIKLVLVPADQQNAATISGNQSKVSDVTVKVKGDQLVIYSSKGVNKGDVTVYVPVKDLSYIDLKEGASVAGKGDLKFNNLTVFVNIDSRMELEMIGNINIKPADNCDFVYEKKEIAKVVYIKP